MEGGNEVKERLGDVVGRHHGFQYTQLRVNPGVCVCVAIACWCVRMKFSVEDGLLVTFGQACMIRW